MAAVRAAPMAGTVSSGATMTTPPTVLATAVPSSSAPAKLPAVATASACAGVAARVEPSGHGVGRVVKTIRYVEHHGHADRREEQGRTHCSQPVGAAQG